jgi:signal recognition particle receptor subunit beta
MDDIGLVPNKTVTTVAMDFGRLTVDQGLVLYLFGTPGQDRFWFMWDHLVHGAMGAIVLVDTRRLADCFGAIDYFDNIRLPFVVVINNFDGSQLHTFDQVADALALESDVPVMACDARSPEQVKQVLIAVAEHALKRLQARS